MEGVIAAIILTAIAVGVILTVYVGKRNRAKQTLLVDKPSQKKLDNSQGNRQKKEKIVDKKFK